MKVTRQITVLNANGLHARPAMQFVDLANSFESAITVLKEKPEPLSVDGKSVMQMMILEATQGTNLTIEAEGEDAETAIEQLAVLFEEKFGED